MKNVDKIIDIAYAELEEITKNGKFRTAQEIDTAYKLMGIIKRGVYVENEGDESSYDSYDSRSYRGQRRDSMGRYSRSRDSYHGDEDFVEEMRSLMSRAPDEQTRTSMRRMIEQMR